MADWKSVITGIGKTAASIATHGASDKIIDAISENKNLSQQTRDELAMARLQSSDKLRDIEAGIATKMIDASAQAIVAVNATMQTEAKSEHWMQWSWRPTCGFTLAALIINNFILVPYFQPWGIKPIDVPQIVWTTLLAVVGVTAFTRGAKQFAENWNTSDDSKE